ncbi:hypothetical protein EUBVEN_00416 [Eubacterium ventriosum ATCC 27560]|uniref:Uncharacterized protein n=1 Tax=Eubacterium ventriosum ATCC 27560 TaxID=411463 RepID=A5Z411_9FIRM|nr:hypothetical protein EUBVEN_00416 [Eubacterium ventriosum ATCC 27560]
MIFMCAFLIYCRYLTGAYHILFLGCIFCRRRDIDPSACECHYIAF